MTKRTDSRTSEEVIFDRYWAHAYAQLYGLSDVESRTPEGGYVRQPVDAKFLRQVETALDVRDALRFRAEIHVSVRCMFEAIGRMPSTAEILQRIPYLSAGISNFAQAQFGRTA